MVRLVFRPYTQIRRSICTLESLRASTRVSPGFALHRHSSPSFGSQQICSHSNLSSENHDRSMVRLAPPTADAEAPFTFIAHRGFHTRVLAYMLDSLVRVSRRVEQSHFVSIVRHLHLSRLQGTEGWLNKRSTRRSEAAIPPTPRDPPRRN
jgi:hypothetical protein